MSCNDNSQRAVRGASTLQCFFLFPRFDNSTGIFTTVTPGRYYFSISFQSSGKLAGIEIRKNQVAQCNIYVNDKGAIGNDANYEPGSCAALLDLKVNDKVDAYIERGEDGALDASRGERIVFNGFQL